MSGDCDYCQQLEGKTSPARAFVEGDDEALREVCWKHLLHGIGELLQQPHGESVRVKLVEEELP